MAKKRASKQVKSVSVNKLMRQISTGKLTYEDVLKEYGKMRETAMSRIRRIVKSDIPFYTAERPQFSTVRQIKDMRSLVREYVDLARWMASPYSTVSGRKNTRKEAIETLHKHGYDWVNISNYLQFVEFMQWFKASEYSAKYDSNADIIENVAEEVASTGLNPDVVFALYKERMGVS